MWLSRPIERPGVLFDDPLKGGGELVLAAFVLGLDGARDQRRGELDAFEHPPVLGERVARSDVLQLGTRKDIADGRLRGPVEFLAEQRVEGPEAFLGRVIVALVSKRRIARRDAGHHAHHADLAGVLVHDRFETEDRQGAAGIRSPVRLRSVEVPAAGRAVEWARKAIHDEIEKKVDALIQDA